MSGGHWEYGQDKIYIICEEVAEDEEVLERFPILAAYILRIGTMLKTIIKDIDWDISGDALIDNDKDFELRAILRIKEALKIYER